VFELDVLLQRPLRAIKTLAIGHLALVLLLNFFSRPPCPLSSGVIRGDFMFYLRWFGLSHYFIPIIVELLLNFRDPFEQLSNHLTQSLLFALQVMRDRVDPSVLLIKLISPGWQFSISVVMMVLVATAIFVG
jgi:hypothetical protein